MKIQPAPHVYRSLGHDNRARGSADSRWADSAALEHDDGLCSHDAKIRRTAADPGFVVLSAAVYVAQQLGQSLAAEDEGYAAGTAASYRRCEEAIGAILRPPMVTVCFII